MRFAKTQESIGSDWGKFLREKVESI